MFVRTFVGFSIATEEEAADQAQEACNTFLRENFITKNELVAFKVNIASHADQQGALTRFSYIITLVTANL